jgi:alcohol dehydrogenase YqhD (iron-dependent ADH family)
MISSVVDARALVLAADANDVDLHDGDGTGMACAPGTSLAAATVLLRLRATGGEMAVGSVVAENAAGDAVVGNGNEVLDVGAAPPIDRESGSTVVSTDEALPL